MVFYNMYWPGDKIADSSPSYSWFHFGEPFRRLTQQKTLPGPLPDPGRLKPDRGVKKCCKTPKTKTNTPLSLGLRNTWLPGGSGGLLRLDEYEHWVCYGAGG